MLNQKGEKNQVNEISAVKAKKSLGQNFLVDNNIITFIVDSLDIKPDDIIVEIGPGHGELTEHIVAKNPKKLILIEKDKRLISHLNEEFKESVEIIEGDALEVIRNLKLEIRNSDNYKIIGNIPYYITGHLLRILGEPEHKPETIVLTIQKEVALRICAKPPQMNLLAASVQFWGEPELLKIIDKKKFNPTPKIDSAVIKITTGDKKQVNNQVFYKLIKILFKQPRKTILNNLKEALKQEELTEKEFEKIIKKSAIDLSLRPQNLSIEDIIKITNIVN